MLWLSLTFLCLTHVTANTCQDSCVHLFSSKLHQLAPCSRFQHSPPIPTTQLHCDRGLDIGIELGCLHVCTTFKSEWQIASKPLQQARIAACRTAQLTNGPRTCEYGYHFAVFQVFEQAFSSSFETDRSNTSISLSSSFVKNVSEAYVGMLIHLPSNAMGYIYMEEHELPLERATKYCAKWHFQDPEEEHECIAMVQLGLQDKIENQEWMTEYPRVQLVFPMEINHQHLNLVAFEGVAPEITTKSFCSQLGTTEKDYIICYKHIYPRLTQELTQVNNI